MEKADAYANYLMNRILSSSVWSKGNNALVIVWDEGTTNACDTKEVKADVPALRGKVVESSKVNLKYEESHSAAMALFVLQIDF